jgi:rubrerythrin
MDKVVGRLVKMPRGKSREIAGGIALAKKIEERAEEFYRENAAKAKAGDLRKAFGFLALEEQKHLAVLEKAERLLVHRGKLAMGVAAQSKPPKIYSTRRKGKENSWGKNELTILLWAMRAERKTELFYRRQAEKSGAGAAGKFFTALAEFEAEHYDFLDGIFSLWTSTDDYILG